MDEAAQARQQRAAARHGWPVKRHELGSEPNDDLSEHTSPRERLAMMWPLARDAWRLAGQPLPDYQRDQMPGRVVRRHETLDE